MRTRFKLGVFASGLRREIQQSIAFRFAASAAFALTPIVRLSVECPTIS
jgi:hypothetical protein